VDHKMNEFVMEMISILL